MPNRRATNNLKGCTSPYIAVGSIAAKSAVKLARTPSLQEIVDKVEHITYIYHIWKRRILSHIEAGRRTCTVGSKMVDEVGARNFCAVLDCRVLYKLTDYCNFSRR